jgi:hypothetical protein
MNGEPIIDVRGIGSELWPIALFVVVARFIAMKRYRQTLD